MLGVFWIWSSPRSYLISILILRERTCERLLISLSISIWSRLQVLVMGLRIVYDPSLRATSHHLPCSPLLFPSCRCFCEWIWVWHQDFAPNRGACSDDVGQNPMSRPIIHDFGSIIAFWGSIWGSLVGAHVWACAHMGTWGCAWVHVLAHVHMYMPMCPCVCTCESIIVL